MKGQLVTLDFIPALFLFIGIFIGILVSWNAMIEQIDDVNVRNEMERNAVTASDSLVRYEGNPNNWNRTNVVVLGLSDDTRNVLSSSKVSELLAMNYSRTKTLLGITYNFYIELNKTSGAAFTIGGNQTAYGIAPVNATNIIVVRRYVILNDEAGVLTMKVWV